MAYKYAFVKDDPLAMYHYKILSDKDPGSTNWNNLGVALEKLELHSMSIESYQKSKDLGGTLAVSNIANRLVSVGFLNEAEKICNDALQIENYDKRVAESISSIRKVKDDEVNQEKEILQDLEPKRLFYIEYAKASTKKTLSDIQDIFEGPNCTFEIKIDKWKIELRAHSKINSHFLMV